MSTDIKSSETFRLHPDNSQLYCLVSFIFVPLTAALCRAEQCRAVQDTRRDCYQLGWSPEYPVDFLVGGKEGQFNFELKFKFPLKLNSVGYFVQHGLQSYIQARSDLTLNLSLGRGWASNFSDEMRMRLEVEMQPEIF